MWVRVSVCVRTCIFRSADGLIYDPWNTDVNMYIVHLYTAYSIDIEFFISQASRALIFIRTAKISTWNVQSRVGFESVCALLFLPIIFHILSIEIKSIEENFCLLLLFRQCFTVLMGRLVFGVRVCLCVCVRSRLVKKWKSTFSSKYERCQERMTLGQEKFKWRNRIVVKWKIAAY